MKRLLVLLAVVAGLALAFFIGRSEGKRKATAEYGVLTVTDTLWREVHDTAFVEVETLREVIRRDTVRLAAVSKMDGATAESSSVVHDTVTVEVPVSLYTFTGDNYKITAEGYAVALRDVWFNYPTIVQTQTVTKTKRWAFTAGVQVGYGLTAGGFSPYAGLGVTFGYVF